jgi:energy-coupling factor transporter ATP-binding protein EcfA2
MKLSGKNFQPWQDFSLDISGLTVLTGPSNKGKSSLFRALRGILRNELDAAYIRDPKKEPLELTLEINGLTIKATRNKAGKVKYVLNGDEKNAYTSLDGHIPPPVKDLLCGEITIGDFDFDPIFGVQNDPQFLLDKRAYKASDLNAILGAFGGTEKLEAGKKEAGSRISDKNGEAKILAEEIRNAEERKSKLMVLSANGDCLQSTLHELELRIRLLDAKSVWVGEATSRLTRLKPLERLQNALAVPNTTTAEQLAQQIAYLTQAAESRILSKWLGKVTTVIDSTSEPWAALLAVWRKLVAVETLRQLVESRREFPSIGDTGAQYSALVGTYSSIKTIGQVIELRRSLKAKTAELTQIDSELTQAQEELKKGLCPKCGKPVEHICA